MLTIFLTESTPKNRLLNKYNFTEKMNFQSTKMPAELRRTNPEEKVSLKMSSGEIKKPLVNERLDFIGGNEGGGRPPDLCIANTQSGFQQNALNTTNKITY